MLELQHPISIKKNRTNKENRQYQQLKTIISHLSKSNEGLSIPEIAKNVNTSVPTCTKLVKELLNQELVIEKGKKVTDNGRKPTVYGINKNKFYVVGVEILSKWIHVSVIRVDLKTAHENLNREFVLENSSECLEFIVQFIKTTIKESGIELSQIIGVGIGMTGSVNGHTGEPVWH